VRLITDEELETLTKTSRTLRWRERRRGRLCYLLLGGRVRYTEEQVRAWLARCEKSAQEVNSR
jgi:predicted DNA-binding transcriptional regulator AlpA